MGTSARRMSEKIDIGHSKIIGPIETLRLHYNDPASMSYSKRMQTALETLLAGWD
jgi:hypothetical protein